MQGMALHAVVLGVQSKTETTEADANEKKAQAETVYKEAGDAANMVLREAGQAAKKTRDAAHGRQDKRIADGKQAVADAKQELDTHRAQVLGSLGIEVPDYLAQARVGGGSVKL